MSKTVFQLAGQALLPPALDGLVPPHGPFPARQPIDRLEVHHRTESLDVVHVFSSKPKTWPVYLRLIVTYLPRLLNIPL